MKLPPHIHLFRHLPSSSCSVLKNFMAASLPPFITTWIKRYMKKNWIAIFNREHINQLHCVFAHLHFCWSWFADLEKKNLSLDKHYYSCFRNPPLVATWKGWTRICNKMDGLLSCIFFTAATFMRSSFLSFLNLIPTLLHHQQYHQQRPRWCKNLLLLLCKFCLLRDGANVYEALQKYNLWGRKRLFELNNLAENDKHPLGSASQGWGRTVKCCVAGTKHWKYKSWKDQKSEHQALEI